MSSSPYTIMVGRSSEGKKSRPSLVETGATGTQAATFSGDWANMGTRKLPLMEGLTTTGGLAGLRLDMTEPRYSPLFSVPRLPPVLP